MRSRIAEEWAIFRLALQLLTRLPVGEPEWSPKRMAATPKWYPAVGIIVGLVSGAVLLLALVMLPPITALLLAVAVGILVTGAFHEDGFADCCDGLGGGSDRERVLEIMKDSQLGSYGVLGLLTLFAVKISALHGLPPASVPAALIAGHALSRLSAVMVMATSSYVREAGTGATVSGSVTGLPMALVAAGIAFMPMILWFTAAQMAMGFAGLLVGHIVMRQLFEKRLGGYTGDCLGAVQQLSETCFYLGIVMLAD